MAPPEHNQLKESEPIVWAVSAEPEAVDEVLVSESGCGRNNGQPLFAILSYNSR